MKAFRYYFPIPLAMVLLVLLAEKGFTKPSRESLKLPCWCGKKITVVTLTYDDEIISRSDISGALSMRLSQAGVPVVAEVEEADWVLIPTVGKMAEVSTFSTATSHEELASSLRLSPVISNKDNTPSTTAKAGLLLSLYKASDWELLTSQGKIPKPLWMGYHETEADSQSTNACTLLVNQVTRDLFMWNGSQSKNDSYRQRE